MPKREIITVKQNSAQFAVQYQRNGYGGVIPVIDGVPHPELMMGYVSETDLEAGMNLLSDALDATQGNIPEAMRYMYAACKTAANDIKAEDSVEVNGIHVVISYEACAAYVEGNEIANLADVEMARCFPPIAIKAMLIDRIKNALEEEECDYDEE